MRGCMYDSTCRRMRVTGKKKEKKFTEYTAQQAGTQLINHSADLASSFLPIQSRVHHPPINQSIKNFTFRPSN